MLKKLGYSESFVIFTGMDAIEKAQEFKPDLVLMDIKLKDEAGKIEVVYLEELIKSLNRQY